MCVGMDFVSGVIFNRKHKFLSRLHHENHQFELKRSKIKRSLLNQERSSGLGTVLSPQIQMLEVRSSVWQCEEVAGRGETWGEVIRSQWVLTLGRIS